MTYTLATLEDTTLGHTPEETEQRTHTKCLEVGRKNYFKRDDVEAWIDEQTIQVSA